LDIDEELCRACGKLMIAYAAPRISFMAVFFGVVCTWFREALLRTEKKAPKKIEINPATGLPVVGRRGRVGGIDVAGNVYGVSDE
jgi:hypothetical protein